MQHKTEITRLEKARRYRREHHPQFSETPLTVSIDTCRAEAAKIQNLLERQREYRRNGRWQFNAAEVFALECELRLERDALTLLEAADAA